MTQAPGPPAQFQPPMTPALVVRRAALEQNLAAMQGLCDAAGVKLRPQLLPATISYLNAGARTIRGWLQQQRARAVHFNHEADFANYNSPQDMENPSC